jgi:RNA polymerase sigma factor (sigma-70 family)
MSGDDKNRGRRSGFGTEHQRRAPPRPLTSEQQRALTELYELHYKRLVRFAERSLPATAVHRPEDMAQVVFTEAALALSAGHASLGAGWLYDRMRSRIVDQWRRADRQRVVEPEGADDAVELLRDPAQTPEEEVVGRDYVERLLAVVLHPTDREALRYRLAGYSEREIAALMSLDYKRRQVRERIKRAAKQLKKWQLDEWPSGK